jgi:aryl carrier-like protein
MLQVFLEQVDAAQCATLVRVVCSGEALPAPLVKRFHALLPRVELHNLYGPTEAAVDVTAWQCVADDARDTIPIGRPVANTQLYILDKRLRPVPIGVAGELYLAGVQVGRGYLNRPELTAERFVHDPFAASADARMYRTGDLARYQADGNVVYLGRIDHQVKIRGFRIELGEIEGALGAIPGVKEAVVTVKEDHGGDRRLVAHVVPDGAAEQEDPARLRTALAMVLPDYMVPAHFILHDRLPLTPNGKVNRNALVATAFVPVQKSYAPPGTPVERALVEVWEKLLGASQVGIDDNFFDMGGNSIMSARVVYEAKKLGIGVTTRMLFAHPTVRALAAQAAVLNAGQAGRETDGAPAVDAPPRYHPLPANRHWFLRRTVDLPLWGTAIALEMVDHADHAEAMRAVTRHLLVMHDTLRLQLVLEAGAWRERVASPDNIEAYVLEDLSSYAPGEIEAAFGRKFDAYKNGLAFADSLFKVVYYRMGDGVKDIVQLVLHHFIFDQYSLGILFDDMQEAFAALSRGLPPPRRMTSVSVSDWADAECRWVNSDAAKPSKAFWLAHDFSTLPRMAVDFGVTPLENSIESTRVCRESLSKEDTGCLRTLMQSNSVSVLDLVIASMVEGLAPAMGRRALGVEVVNSARQCLSDDVDVADLVGWVNEFIPVFVDLEDMRPGLPSLRALEKRVAACMTHGRGFNAIRYHDENAAVRAAFEKMPDPEIALNYIPPELATTTDKKGGDGAGFPPPLRWEPIIGGRREAIHLLSCEVRFDGECLTCAWTYSENVYRRETIERHLRSTMAAMSTFIHMLMLEDR